MKTKKGYISGVLVIATALVLTSGAIYAEGDIAEVYATGSTITSAGDFVVQSTDKFYHFQGEKYELYKVYYEDSAMNLSIAVNPGRKCKSFIAFANDYTAFYECDRNGFGIRKIIFTSQDAQKRFDTGEYQKQTVLSEQVKIDKKDAVTTIAEFLPKMQSV